MPHAIWKGAISFGLVHIPVALYAASREQGLDFDWLDKRSMDPVGYKRINKRTGKEIEKAQIVRGIKHAGDDYVVLSDDDIATAYPKSTQTIEIEAFVRADEIAFVHLERPYYLAPIGRGEKVYALLREALFAAGRVGVARLVIASKEHLAALIPAGPALMLNTLRWADEIRPLDELALPPAGRKATGLKDTELRMAAELIDSMAAPWQPDLYSDRFRDAILALVERKVAAGQTQAVRPLEDSGAEPATSNVVDLTELLKRSLKRPATDDAAPSSPKRSAAPRSPAAKRPAGPAAKAPAKPRRSA
ncbi:MAG: Ku protein [Burkholderiales bacterium]